MVANNVTTLVKKKQHPTVSTESVSLTTAMEAEQGQKVQTCDTPSAFAQTTLDDIEEQTVSVSHGTAAELLCEIATVCEQCLERERGQSVIHVECTNMIHGTPKAAPLFHKAFENDLEVIGFEINPCDCCTANEIIVCEQ